MNENAVQLIAAVTIAVCQVYVMEPWKFPVFARFWDYIACICGILANMLGWWSMRAREKYYTVLSEMT